MQVALVDASRWVTSVTASGPDVRGNAPLTVRVVVNSSGLAPQTYRDAVRVTSSLGSFEVPIVLTVLPAGPVMSLSQTGVRFVARQGGPSPDADVVQVLNVGDPLSPVLWRARILRGTDLIILTPPQGSSTDPTGLRIGLASGPTLAWEGDRIAWNMHLPVQQYQDDNRAANAGGPYDTAPGVLPPSMSWWLTRSLP